MTNHYIDVKNADCILIIGSNAAEHHPISFKWVMRAKEERNATLIHVDPKFSRTSARCDFHVPIRSGTDIAFLGGMIKYILDNELYFKEYVTEYTNASFIVNEKFSFKDGLFSGLDGHKYDRSSWTLEMDEKGIPKKDKTFAHERCVLNMLRKHYSRYTLDTVSEITGVSKENLLKVYQAYAATGKKNMAGTVLYAIGWTQHTVGVQNIRACAMIQLLLGNIGIAGGGVNALRGEPNVQGSTDHAMLASYLPGYLTIPNSEWQTLADYLKTITPVCNDPASANWWQNTPKYVVSLLKSWYGKNATKENDFGYKWLPKPDAGVDYSVMFLYDRMYKGSVKGGFIFAHNPAQSLPNTNKIRKAMTNLDWLAVAETNHTESSDFWHGPGLDPKQVKTEVFILASAHRLEKEGSVSNSGRWTQWHYQAVPPQGQTISMGESVVGIFGKVRELYKEKGGACPEQILNMDWPDKYDPEDIAKKVNGYFLEDVTVDGKLYKSGSLVPSFSLLQADGTTANRCWVYAGSYSDQEGNKFKKRDFTQTPMQKKIGLFPHFSWCWPVNRRIIYNRASVDLNGKPWDPERAVIEWDGEKWVGDVPDGPWAPLATGKGRYPFIMTTQGFSQLFGPGRYDGPFPEHYEPIETPIKQHSLSPQLHNPCAKIVTSDMDQLAPPGDERFPIVLTTYNMTEHWCGGGETRNTPVLLEAEPQLYVEMSPELATEKGIKNGDPVVVSSIRGRVEAIAMVTVRMRPFKVMGKTVHEIGMPFTFGWTTPGRGDATNRLTPSVGDPNTSIPEYKACCVNIEKTDKVTELYQ